MVLLDYVPTRSLIPVYNMTCVCYRIMYIYTSRPASIVIIVVVQPPPPHLYHTRLWLVPYDPLEVAEIETLLALESQQGRVD